MMFRKTRYLWTLCASVCSLSIIGTHSLEKINATETLGTYIPPHYRDQDTNSDPGNDMVDGLNAICKHYLAVYANVSSSFMKCAVLHAKPLNFCERCVDKYMLVLKAFTLITNETKCSSHLLRSDYLQVISKTNSFLKELWNSGNCDNCFEIAECNDTYRLNEKTRHFFHLYNQTNECFRNFSMTDIFPASLRNTSLGPLCTECQQFYSKMYKAFTNMGMPIEMCVDVLEKMNHTQKIWSIDYHCNVHDKSREVVMAMSLFFCLLPIIFYIVVRWYGVKQYKQSAS